MKHEAPPHNRLLALIILLALLLHILIMLLFSWNDHFRLSRFEANVPENQSSIQVHNDDQQWVTRKAASSAFSAPVIFQQEPATEEYQAQQIVDEPADKENQNPSSEEYHQQEIPTQDAYTEQTVNTKSEATNLTKQPATMIKPTESTKQSIRAPSTQPVKPKKKILRRYKPEAPIEKNNFNLNQLAQGFLDYVRGTGNAGVEIRANREGIPTDEQLKHERYWQKIAWWMQKTSKIYQDQLKKMPVYTQTAWQMLLNRDGSIAYLTLVQPSGMPTLDKLLHTIIHEASSSFPPVPAYFLGSHYKLNFVLFFES